MGLFGSMFGKPDKELTPSQFTSEFVDRFRASMPGVNVVINCDLELKVTTASGHITTSFLHNAYDVYKGDPKAKTEIIDRFVQSHRETVLNSQATESLDRTRIIAVVKDRLWLEETRQAMIKRGAKKLPENVYDDLNADLVVLYAEDSPKNIRYFSPADLEKAGIERKELRTLACENLKRVIPKIERHGGNGLFMLSAGGDYEASLLLFESIWDDFKKEITGDVVVAIPTRDVLIVTGSENTQGLEQMKQIVKKATAEGSYRLTTKLFVYRFGEFEEFKS
jgi:uncharacterized protein YtpQ (UPF0354 family)